MSNTSLTILQQRAPAAADVAKYYGESNISDRVTVPSVTFSGKIWTVSHNGRKTQLIKRDEDGEETPLAVMKVVILDYAKRRGRQYYEGEYDPEKISAPVCWSDDGKTLYFTSQRPGSRGTAWAVRMDEGGEAFAVEGAAGSAAAEYALARRNG